MTSKVRPSVQVTTTIDYFKISTAVAAAGGGSLLNLSASRPLNAAGDDMLCGVGMSGESLLGNISERGGLESNLGKLHSPSQNGRLLRTRITR